MKRMRDQKIGFAALVVFIGGMVVAPLGHLIGHRDDHHHGQGGAIEHTADGCTAEPEHVEPSRARRTFSHAWEREQEAREAREHTAEHARCGDLATSSADHSAQAEHAEHAPGDRQPSPAPRKPSDHGAGALQHFGVSLLTTVAIDFVSLDGIVVAARPASCTPQRRVARRHHTPGSARAPPA